MERYRLTTWDSRRSTANAFPGDLNTKIAVLAEDLVSTGQLPGLPLPEESKPRSRPPP